MSGGLSTLNFMQGAMEGYRFMEDRKDKQLNRERQLRLDEMAETDQKAKHGLYEVQADAARTRAEHDKLKLEHDIADRPEELKQREIDNKNRETEFGLRRMGLEKGNAALDAQKDRDVTAKQMAELTMKELKTKQSQLQVQALANHIKAQEAGQAVAATPEEKHQMALLNIVDPDVVFGEKGAVAKQVFEGLLSGDIDYRDPVVSDVLMTRFPAIQAIGKENGYNVIAAHLQPVPDKAGEFTIGLEIEGKDKLEPLTDHRSTDPNDTVTVVTFDELADSFEKMVAVQKLANTEAGRAYIKETARLMTGGDKKPADQWEYEIVDGIPGQKNLTTGKFEQFDLRKTTGMTESQIANLKVRFREVMNDDYVYGDLNRAVQDAKTDKERQEASRKFFEYAQSQWDQIIGEEKGRAGEAAQQNDSKPDYAGDGTLDISTMTPQQRAILQAAKAKHPDMTDKELDQEIRAAREARNGAKP